MMSKNQDSTMEEKQRWRLPELIALKLEGKALSDAQMEFFVKAISDHSLQDAQLGAFLMAVFLKGMTTAETVSLTKHMMGSGTILQWPSDWVVVDKHSTGGVGDKVSIPLAPALASCGLKVPMISGRGLGHTGGTLDKLESIPGYKVSMTEEEIRTALAEVGCCIVGQTGNLVPADKRMYATRDITSTVASKPLIVSSIISKKAAESPSILVLDVKFGCGTFMKTVATATELAQAMVDTAKGLGIQASALITSMDTPIGRHVGNSLEIIESIQCLNGGGPDDLKELVVKLGSQVLVGSGICKTPEEGDAKIEEVLQNGTALKKFSQMLQKQGVDKVTAEKLCFSKDFSLLPKSVHTTSVLATNSGTIKDIDALEVALVSLELGAGRSKAGDAINYGVGVFLNKVVGEKVAKGEVWATIHHDTERLPNSFYDRMTSSLTVMTSSLTVSNDELTVHSRIVNKV